MKCRHDERTRTEAKEQAAANATFEQMDLGCDSGYQAKSSRKRKRDESFSPPRRTAKAAHRRLKIPPLSMPRDIMSRPKVVRALKRHQVTPAATSDIFAAAISESGGDPADYFLSPNHHNTKTKELMVEWANEKRESYKPPDAPIVLSDGKKVERNGIVEERLTISIAGDERPPQHIGSFPLVDAKGETIAKETVDQCAKWGVGKEGKDPVMQLWDTAANNAGTLCSTSFLCEKPPDLLYVLFQVSERRKVQTEKG